MLQCFTKSPLASAQSMDRVDKPEAGILFRRLLQSFGEVEVVELEKCIREWKGNLFSQY